ncbi:uncharacterized protein LOC108474989 [Gossypium arboreum]|uniref:uncharacterized protein LOC108474989 n=1 Tax=Gossypium arboreum TaxID=29729 RepID=UPI00081960F2|nr:uncharacterized protein LOC108474989 [Gossypium arboreum]
MAQFEAFYGRNCRTPLCQTELDERQVVGPDLVREIEAMVKLICDRLKATSDRKKSSIDMKHRDIKFRVGDKVFMKVSLRRRFLDLSHVVPVEEIEVRTDLTYEEELVEILARKEKVLRNK